MFTYLTLNKFNCVEIHGKFSTNSCELLIRDLEIKHDVIFAPNKQTKLQAKPSMTLKFPSKDYFLLQIFKIKRFF